MAKSIMVQGTMSNVGKSLLVTALCRIFRQDGFSCVPFKSQNMALNSHVTVEGGEIGTAQAVQALSAGVDPSVLMNPILLKPTADSCSQVIVGGKVLKNMTSREYFGCRSDFIPVIMDAYGELDKNFDIIVIEGAGSPAELNLKKDDIVNMGIAKLTNSPVLLVGDIDCGGVFAQLLGTLDLLEKQEKEFVKALVVNKFRGDRRLFSEGVKILEEKSNRPVLGVVPYTDCDIESEDSISDRLEKRNFTGEIDIAVVRLPRISNFTDFDVFTRYEGVSVRYVRNCREFGRPDMIFIPGTKNTISDMKWLRETGLENAVKKLNSQGVPVFGICGGYQILGRKISDPHGTECGGEISGMGLLDGETVLTSVKKTSHANGKFCNITGFFDCMSGAGFSGYEIHAGETSMTENSLTTCGGEYKDSVAGCYVHGIFDDSAEKLLKKLSEKKGLEMTFKKDDNKIYRETQFDILANCVRNNIDMELLYKIIDKGV